MERTGIIERTRWFLLAVAGLAIGCGGEANLPDDGAMPDRPIDSIFDPPIDGPPIDMGFPIDAVIDAAGCGQALLLRGYYYDWDSTLNDPINLGGSRWTVRGAPTSAETAPSGLVSMCIPATGTSLIDISGPPGYLGAVFVADADVFSAGPPPFILRGLQTAMASAQYNEFLSPPSGYSSGRAHVMVYNYGAPIPLALDPVLNPPQNSFVSGGGFSDTTWTAGAAGKLTLFPNRPSGNGTATLTSTASFAGPTAIPLIQNAFTIVVIRAQ
jgi:hypothetical protein